MHQKMIARGLVLLTLIIYADFANATLYVRGEGSHDQINSFKLIFDDIYNVTWYDFSWDSAQWNTQCSLADNVVIHFNGKQLDNWRLPSAFNLDGSLVGRNVDFYGQVDLSEIGEFGSLWGQLEEGGYYDTTGVFQEGSPFDANIDHAYWSNTEYNIGPTPNLYLRFHFGTYWVGYDLEPDWSSGKGIIVWPGDVGMVPEPATMLLFGTGLACLVATRIRKKKKSNFLMAM